MRGWKVEVLDVGGAGVGWTVYVAETAEKAIRHLSVKLAEPWAGDWVLSGPGVTLSGKNGKEPRS